MVGIVNDATAVGSPTSDAGTVAPPQDAVAEPAPAAPQAASEQQPPPEEPSMALPALPPDWSDGAAAAAAATAATGAATAVDAEASMREDKASLPPPTIILRRLEGCVQTKLEFNNSTLASETKCSGTRQAPR